MAIEKVIFLIHDDKILFRKDYTSHDDWARNLGISEEDFKFIVRGVAIKEKGHWSAYFHYNNEQNDGRSSAAAKKFAPELLTYCKASTIEVFADEEPFIVRKEDYHKEDHNKESHHKESHHK
jgi:hypothetical protein